MLPPIGSAGGSSSLGSARSPQLQPLDTGADGAPSGAGRPAAAQPRPAGLLRSRTLVRTRSGTSLFGIPLTALVGVELVGAALLLEPHVSAVTEVVVVALAVLAAVAVLVPFRGMRLGTWVAVVVAFGARRHVLSAPRPATSEPEQDDLVGVPAEVGAVFPGLTVLRGRARSSRGGEGELGMVQWQGRWLAVAEVSVPEGDVLSTTAPQSVPVDRLLSALAGKGFGLDAVQVCSQSLFGELDRHGQGAVSRIAAELAATGTTVRGREVWLAVRIDPVTAGPAIAARGGGVAGLSRLASAALGRIVGEATSLGFVVRPLGAEPVLAAMTGSLLQQPAADATAPRWEEQWKAIASATAHHRSYAVTSWHGQSLDSLSLTAGYGLTVAHEIQDLDGDPRVLTVLRVTASSPSQLDRAGRQLRAGCRGLGVGLRLLRGQQAGALRATMPGGQR